MGSNRISEGDDAGDDICINPGTVWSPASDEIPDVAATVGRQYSYGVLYSGYWDAPLEGGARDMEIIVPKKSTTDSNKSPNQEETDKVAGTEEATDDSGTGKSNNDKTVIPSDYDSTKASVERSWDNRDPGLVLSDDVGPESGGKEEFYTEYEKAIYRPVTEEPDWDYPTNWDSEKSKEYCDSSGLSFTLDKNHSGDGSKYRFILTPYTFNSWYRESDAVKDTQHNDNPSQFMYPVCYDDKLSADALRAIKILGEDILLRDEWVGSTIFKTGTNSPNYFGYTYSTTNVLDNRKENDKYLLSSNLLTADYVIQSIYRALGVNNLRGQVYFYADKDLTVDFTPLAEKITVAMDKINQVQNRVDVFVTRTDLDGYWAKAVEDGIVSNYGVSVINNIDAAYKPFAKKLDSKQEKEFAGLKYIDGTWVDESTGLKYEDGTWVEFFVEQIVRLDKTGKEVTDDKGNVIYDDVTNTKRIDYNRTKTMTLAEFCVYVKKTMDLYGEEVLTDKEMEMLLVYYGTKLPYNLESEEQLEAIKYLMAKGIVNDMMYWEGPLTIEDMLIILSRVKDESSRLTFKEIELEYDPDLVSMGYCPAELSFVEETSMGVVATTLNESYNYKDAEWIDYFLRMPSTVKSKEGKKEINPRFLRTEGAQEYITNDLFVTKRKEKDEDNKDNDEDAIPQYTYVCSDTSTEGENGIEVVGYENLEDGYEYLHIKVKTSLILKDNSPNIEYVNPKNSCIYINTKDNTDAPICWKIDYRGGIFRNPVLANGMIKWESSNYYTKGTKYTISKATQDLSAYKLKPEDFDALAEHKTCKSLIVSLNIDGTVKDAYTYTTKKGNDTTLQYMSFDQAGWGYKYCDYERYTNGLAISFARNPMLDSVGKALAEALPQYDIWFYLLSDSTHTDWVSCDLYIGETLVVKKSKPKEILYPESKIEYLGYNEGKYYYVARGQNSEKSLSDNLHTDTGVNINASFCTGYIKQNNTILVKDTDLINIVNITGNLYKDGAITRINDDTLCLSFDVIGADNMDQITHTIYMCESLKLLAVNNMIYKIPDDEVLFVDNTASGGSYLLNYRAVIGWGSGYQLKTNVSANGTVEVRLSTQEKGDSGLYYVVDGVLNAYTLHSIPSVLIGKQAEDTYAIPATAPNNTASWFVYNSYSEGTYAVILKNNDSAATDSIVKLTIKDEDDIAKLYTDSPGWLDKFFGVLIGNKEWRDSDVLVSMYSLTPNGESSKYMTTIEAVKKKDASCYGKFYYDSDIGTYAYVPALRDDLEEPSVLSTLRFGHLGMNNTATTKDDQSALVKFSEILRDVHEKYYTGEYLLPYFTLKNGFSMYDASCNVHSNVPYGSVPLWTISFPSKSLIYSDNPLNSDKILGTYQYSDANKLYYPVLKKGTDGIFVTEEASLMDKKDTFLANTTAANPVSIILGISPYELTKENFPSGLRVNWGNYNLAYMPNKNELVAITDIPQTTVMKISTIPAKDKSVYLTGVTMTKQIGFLSSSATLYEYSDNREVLVDKTTKASLEDLDQIGGVNWGAYSFDALIHDIDNGMSILLIIVLNIIPRIGMFVFIILIGLSTVANMKPVKKFCDSIFDPYKLITFGHADVNTINTNTLLISSIIGLAAFGLFMDGTIINLLTWIVQFVSAFVTR